MLIFIPMAGTGDRYIRAHYKEPKPLIPVDGVPMIERVLQAFPEDARFVFGVNRIHAETTALVDTLRRLRPEGRIVVMEPHKDGPVQSVLSCAAELPDDEDVCLNYCDFGVRWNYADFAAWLDRGRWDGAMTAYRGFHPHSLGPTLYAYMRNDGERVTEIREKHHFTDDKFEEFASSGLYWFRRGRDLKRLAETLIRRGERVNGEFYVSMLMQLLIEEKSQVGVYELERFFQWGTPEDLRDYESWAAGMRQLDTFVRSSATAVSHSTHVIPMAGRGQRFADKGYTAPKPLIEVAGQPMIRQALDCLPKPAARVLVAQREHAEDARFRRTLAAADTVPTRVIELDRITEGQACTASIGVEGGVPLDAPLLIAPCDTGYVYDVETWLDLERSPDCDVMLFTARNHLPAIWRPHMYGWLHVGEDGLVRGVGVKKTVEGVPIARQEVITGTFWFRTAGHFLRETAQLMAADDRVNGEFYIDTIIRRMVERGDRVRAFTVDKYLPWGTPEELHVFDYWNAVHRSTRPVGLHRSMEIP